MLRQKNKLISKCTIYLLLIASSLAFAETEMQKINRPLPPGNTASLQLKMAFVSIYNQDRRVGSGSLVNTGQKKGVLTSRHVLEEVCEKGAYVYFQNQDLSWKVSCSDIFASDKEDSSFVDLPKDQEKYFEESSFLELDTENVEQDTAVIYCDRSVRPFGETVRTHYNGQFINTLGEHRPGCSGSALISNYKVRGIMKGFKLEDRSLLFSRPNFDLKILKALNRNKFSANRGDPIDGGDEPRYEMVYLFPDLPELEFLNTSRRIIHIPEKTNSNLISPQSPTRIIPNVLFTTRNFLETNIPNTWVRPDVGHFSGWNFNFAPFALDYEIQLSVQVKKDKSGQYKIENHLPTENKPTAWLEIATNNLNLSFPKESPQWKISLSPGTLKVADDQIGSFSFLDPNLGYRSILVENKEKVAVYSFEVHAQITSPSRFMEVVITRAVAENREKLRRGDVLEYNFLVVSLQNKPWENSDLQWKSK